ncbi:hypothetical protein [Providencia rustigianii]|uniref:hypothetical protein n=1 Tax=Providencia rustigianii TaxID=158850 RepID=UPI000D9405D4|nr:hypothetical protein [Providencia rustigianii]SPY76743.1 Uncharacterised protein [Providencia rustigianii]
MKKSFNYSSAEGVSLNTLEIPNGDYVYNISLVDDGENKVGEINVLKNGDAIKNIKCDSVWQSNLDNENLMIEIPDADGNTSKNEANSISPSTPVVKIQVTDIPYNQKTKNTATHRMTRHVYVYSLVDNVTINGVNIDRGNCYSWNIKPTNLTYGKSLDFELIVSSKVAYANSGWNWMELNNQYSKCMWGEVEVNTNMGNFTFTIGG